MLNEFLAKKLGEILSFNQVSTDTFEKGRAVLVTAIGEERVMDIEEKNRIHGEEVIRIATDGGVIDTVLAKANADADILKSMREIYIGEHWADAGEIFEWCGFSEGASVAHWALARGAAEALNHEGLLTLSEEAISWHYEVLEMAESELGQIGQDKATG